MQCTKEGKIHVQSEHAHYNVLLMKLLVTISDATYNYMH